MSEPTIFKQALARLYEHDASCSYTSDIQTGSQGFASYPITLAGQWMRGNSLTASILDLTLLMAQFSLQIFQYFFTTF